MKRYVLNFHEISRSQIALVGGKAAQLAELARIDGVQVPPGFCITTDAFRAIEQFFSEQLDTLSNLDVNDLATIRERAAHVRSTIESINIPTEIADAITQAYAQLGANISCAVRSSATAEDLPTASFAGQQDTYLNIRGAESILEHVRRCWASLFTERAVVYRLKNDLDHSKVQMAVVVQQMVFPDVSGVLFTADPITGNRKTASIDASFGLGEALVSGIVNPDVFKVRDNRVIERTINTKRRVIHASANGGTEERALEPHHADSAALADAQAVQLVAIGRKLETHFGSPQDIEWCLADNEFYIVQSRPITTLFPVPDNSDGKNHVYLSVGHQQMMTDAMKPLGLSVWQLKTPRPMAEAGGRLFVDVTATVATPAGRANLFDMFRKSDPLVPEALQVIVDRGDFLELLPNPESGVQPAAMAALAPPPAPIETDPSLVTALVEKSEALIAKLKEDIQGKTGAELLDFILAHTIAAKGSQFDPRSMHVLMAGIDATWWLNDNLYSWLGEVNAADKLTQSVPNNISSEMGLALLHVADAIRPHPQVVAFLQGTQSEDFLREMSHLEGGTESRNAIQQWLDVYGMRGSGEIDITRTRWAERPSMLIPLLLGNIKHFEPGEARRRFEEGLRLAKESEDDLLTRVRALPDGEVKAAETKRMIDRMRTFIGYREYPKYGMMHRDFIYKQAIMQEVDRLVQAGVLHDREDAFFLRFEELQQVVRTNVADYGLIRERKESYKQYESLRPPRVLTSDGEMINGVHRRENIPADALIGLGVSTGIVEGRARVILDMTRANIEPGDILVTAFTDPSWTPVFVSIAGLVTEVGGLMTHGAVVAREYGLPAVVGVENATIRIRDGQRIRLNGGAGFVELLD